MQGWVYLLTNEAMPGYVKIGLTQGDDVTIRVRQLDTTSIPLPFECYFAARVPDCARLERTLHFVFGEKRTRRNREFFRIEPDLAKAIIELVAIEDKELSDADQDIDTEERREIDEARTRREVRTFPGMGIPLGSVLTFLKDDQITCTVVGARRVLFRGEECYPSRAALQAINSMGYDWKAVSGSDYWLFNGIRLCDLPEARPTATILEAL